MSIAELYFDGGSVPNPGKGGCGYYIKWDEGEIKGSIYLGENITNNKAEYNGCINGLKECIKVGIKNVKVYGDSKLAIEQINGKWKVKTESLKPLHDEIMNLKREFITITFTHVLREYNSIADMLSDLAISSEKNLITFTF